MNFTEVVAEVVDITKRPDKLNSIRRNVNSAISLSCLGTDFARDYDEQSIALLAASAVGNISLADLPRFRKIDYVLPAAFRKPLAHIQAANVFETCVEQVNCFYIAGDQLNYKLSAEVMSFKVGYFRYPPVLTDASPTFWLLDVAPFMIIDKAAAITFKGIGDDKSAQQHEGDYRLAYDGARIDLKHGVRYG